MVLYIGIIAPIWCFHRGVRSLNRLLSGLIIALVIIKISSHLFDVLKSKGMNENRAS